MIITKAATVIYESGGIEIFHPFIPKSCSTHPRENHPPPASEEASSQHYRDIIP
jgi:hypothetical protein